MSEDYCQEIANIISQYRLRDRKTGSLNISFDKNHVEKWVSQFEDHHDIILKETKNLLNTYYLSKSDITSRLTKLYTCSEIWGDNIEQAISDTVFLNCQAKGESQNRLYNKSRKIIFDLYGIDIAHTHGGKTYFYIDDCIFSGSTVYKDISNLIDTIPDNSTVTVAVFVVHSFAKWQIKERLKEKTTPKNIYFNIEDYTIIENSGGKNFSYDCLWPEKYVSKAVADYMETLEAEKAVTPDKSIRFFRKPCYTSDVYTSETNRAILEQELMEAGLKIISYPREQKQFIRPMGFDNRISFGFGAFFATYMNMSNNCPLAYWWGDASKPPCHPLSKWYPLLPRKANENSGEIC